MASWKVYLTLRVINWLVSHRTMAINWNSEIIATANELNLAHHDPLWIYFGKQSENTTIFHSREVMQKIVGDFKDVSPDRLIIYP